MGKKADPKQSSIKSFFGARVSSPTKKRKPAEANVENPTQSPVKPSKVEKKRKVEKNSGVNEKKLEKTPEDVGAQAERKVEVEEEEKEEEQEEEKESRIKIKPGRRRLRQRVVRGEHEDSDSDFNLSYSTSKTKRKEIPTEKKSEMFISEKVKRASKEKSLNYGRETKQQMKENAEKITFNIVEAKEKKSIQVETIGVQAGKEEGKPRLDAVAFEASKASSFITDLGRKSETKLTTADDKMELHTDGKVIVKDSFGTHEGHCDEEQEIQYSELAHLFAKIEQVTGRLIIQDLLTAFFRSVILRFPHDLLSCIYLCVCVDLAPPFENLKIGIGDAILMKAIGEATGANLKFIKEMYHKEGDLGKVAQNARSKQKTLSFTSLKPATSRGCGLTVQHVYKQFVKIAKMTGSNSQQQKCSIIKGLLVKCEKEKNDQGAQSAEGAKYIIRGLQGKLRIGLAEKSILMGLTYAFMTDKELKDKEKQQEALAFVKKAFAECPSYNALVAAFYDIQKQVHTAPFIRVRDFIEVAEKCVLTPGTPVSPMLAQPTKAYAMVFDRFEGKSFTCEYKYDGERAQIHILRSGEIAIFSRNFENSTERFPDVKLAISNAAKRNVIISCIIDAEVVAVDRSTNKRLPFQTLSTRSRKNVKLEDIKVPVCIYAFDLLYLNGESFLGTSLAKRREKLRDIFEIKLGDFEFASSIDVEDGVNMTDNPEAMEEAVNKVRNFLEEAVRENCEGLMVKTLKKEATYEPANRSHKWLKLKKDYLDGIGDSADLVPIGAFYGRGKRTGVYGAYLLACFDPDTEMYQPITKLGTGLSDEVLKKFYDQLKEKVVNKPPNDYAIIEGIKPDVWFEASCVWEILGSDLSISPKYTAAIGLVAKDKGISLRFPRFIRIRDDKETTQATSSAQIAELYRAQGLTTVANGEDEEDDDMLI
ncbi:ATP-dependent DNA ligase I [Plasmopara halstedii]|uniref:DNA ligase n=1 Tax=Plasmopara halstedii TaxID=4781 RepID=A0A0P1A8E1_PLAHL|nr:ATP-dependent DNA ligase I [Plasmopara halstedii]CEG36631.1 ATP-dependent DNA ligase I [Plasmopara halstedii]|eukprot:XP_024573000.1 ATP-dependent DNA ligase I [Plasmopara halstedii]